MSSLSFFGEAPSQCTGLTHSRLFGVFVFIFLFLLAISETDSCTLSGFMSMHTYLHLLEQSCPR